MENSPKDNFSTEDAARDQFEKCDINLARTFTENSASYVIKHASENIRLQFSRSLEFPHQLSNELPAHFSQVPNIAKLDENTGVDSKQDLEGSASCSRRMEGDHASPRQHPEISSVSVLENSDESEAKTNQNYLSPFATSRKSDFISPPEAGTVSIVKSLAKNLKERCTPSPEKRDVGTDAVSSPIKRLKITPESESDRPGFKTESRRLNLSFSAPAKISCTSPTNLQIQQTKALVQNNEVSGSLYTPSIPSGRKRIIKRNRSLGSNVDNDQFLSNFVSPPSTANSVHESPTNPQILRNKVSDRDVGESPAEREALIDCSAESNSPAKHSKRGDLIQCASSRTSPQVENEHEISTEPTDASSDNVTIKSRKPKVAQLTSHLSNESVLPSGISEKTDTVIHPTIFTDTPLFKRNVFPKQLDQRSLSVVSFKDLQPDLPEKEIESVVHPHRLNENFSSNHGTQSESQNDTSEEFQSDIEERKIGNFPSVLVKEAKATVADSRIKTPMLKSSQFSPLILNPHLTLSLHLPRRSNSPATCVHSHILEFDTSDKEGEVDQNRSDSSIRIPSPHTQSRYQSNEMPESKRPEIHRGSLSDEILTSRNSSENLNTYACMRNVTQGLFSRFNSEESTASSSLGRHRRSASDGTLTSINLTEIKTEQDQSNSLIKSHSEETPLSRNLPKTSNIVSRATCVGKTLSPGNPSRPTCCTTSPANNPHSDSSYRLMAGVTENLPSSEFSTLRNDPEVQAQPNRNDPLQQRRRECFLPGETFASRNPLEAARGVNVLYMDIIEGQPSTSQDEISTSRNEPEMASRDPLYIPEAEERTSPSSDNTSNSSSSYDSLDLLFAGAPDSPHPENAGRRTVDKLDPHSEYVVEARHLLQWVLKEMMQLNGEDYLWTLFEPYFRRVSQTCTELERLQLDSTLAWYLTKRGYGLWNENLFRTSERSAETCIHSVKERLVPVVAGTIALTLGTSTFHSNLNSFLYYYVSLRNIYSDLHAYPRIYNLEDILDEVCRNRIKTLKIKILNLVLRTLSAFRLILMYMGENSEGISSIRIFELNVREREDREFLRGGIL